MAQNFYRVECAECGNEQKVFSHASTTVDCLVCGEPVAEPRGGQAEIHAEIVEELEVE